MLIRSALFELELSAVGVYLRLGRRDWYYSRTG